MDTNTDMDIDSDNIVSSFAKLSVDKPCNICNKKNTNKYKNICAICCKFLSPHFDTCSCIYCR